MELIKYQHACFTIKKRDAALVVDPGVWSRDFVVPENTVGVVVTHEHPDHFDPEKLQAIATINSDVVIIAHESITAQLPPALRSQAVNAGDTITCGPFTLAFFGGHHATIDTSLAVVANLGVMIDQTLYYPGDSFATPDQPAEILALPVSAPWLKIGEVMDFVRTVQPRRAFPTHDAILSRDGQTLVDRILQPVVEQCGGKYTRIKEPEPL